MTDWTRMGDATAPAAPNAPPAKVVALRIAPNGGVPNHPRWPALVVPGALGTDPQVPAIKSLLEANRWFRVWDWTIFDYHHFHPGAAEVLVVARGRAAIRLGGPDGETVEVGPGDAMVLPPGFGHRREAAADGFTVVGAYPAGQEDRRVVRPGTAEALRAPHEVAAAPKPATDPIWGASGPLLDHWR